jgi:uncharacterized protein DUF6894
VALVSGIGETDQVCPGPIGRSASMPRCFFHVHDGSERPDMEGSEFAEIGQVRSEAVRLTGEILRDMDHRFWDRPEWTLTVTDETGAKVLGLRVLASRRPLASCNSFLLGSMILAGFAVPPHGVVVRSALWI